MASFCFNKLEDHFIRVWETNKQTGKKASRKRDELRRRESLAFCVSIRTSCCQLFVNVSFRRTAPMGIEKDESVFRITNRVKSQSAGANMLKNLEDRMKETKN